MDFYSGEDEEAVAAEVWSLSGNSSGNSAPEETEPAEGTQRRKPRKSRGLRAEGTGLEPATPYGAPHFQ